MENLPLSVRLTNEGMDRQECLSYCSASNDRPVANHSILWHDDNAIANIVGTVLPVRFANLCFVEKPYSTSNARVLIDNGAVNDCPLAYSKTRYASLKLIAHFLNSLIIISSHDKRSVNPNPFRDSASQTHNRIRYGRAGNDAAITYDRVLNLRLFNF